MTVLYILTGVVILYGVYYIGYRKGESDTHKRRNRVSAAFKKLNKNEPEVMEVCVKCGCGRHNHPDPLCNANYKFVNKKDLQND